MKIHSIYYILIFLFVQGCSPTDSKKTVTVSPDYTSAITKSRIWSGIHTKGYMSGGMPYPGNYNLTLTDTSLAILKLGNNKVMFPMVSFPLIYRNTDSIMQTMKFDSTISGWGGANLIYYYSADSLVFQYSMMSMGAYGMDDPLIEYMSLSTHH